MGYQFFLPMVLRWRALRAEAPLSPIDDAVQLQPAVISVLCFFPLGLE